jgi:hypothetical protein
MSIIVLNSIALGEFINLGGYLEYHAVITKMLVRVRGSRENSDDSSVCIMKSAFLKPLK